MCAWLFTSNDDGHEDNDNEHDEDDDGENEPSSLRPLIFFKSPLPCPPPLLIHWWADRTPNKNLLSSTPWKQGDPGSRGIFENLTISGPSPYPQLSWACYALYPINQGVISEIYPQNISVLSPRGVPKVSKFAFPKPPQSCLLCPLTHSTCYFPVPSIAYPMLDIIQIIHSSLSSYNTQKSADHYPIASIPPPYPPGPFPRTLFPKPLLP